MIAARRRSQFLTESEDETMKRFTCLLTCLLLLLTLAAPGFAAQTTEAPAPVSEETPSTPESSQPPEGGGTVTEPAPTTCTHTWGPGLVTKNATCKDPGTMTFTCSACGAQTSESIPATGVHTYGDWTASGSGHSRACTGGCGAMETGTHTWDTGSVSQAPTCTVEGTKLYTCTACGGTKTEPIATDTSAHTWGDWVLTETSHSRTCTGCGAVDSGAHYWGITETIEPTCKEEGAKGYGCTICGGVLVEVIPKLDTHTYDNKCDPDCNVCGFTRTTEHKFNKLWSRDSREHWHACTLCGEKSDVARHIPGPAATEDEDQICLTCGLIMTPKLGHVHDYDSSWSFDEDGHWYACDGCDDKKDQDEHVFDDACDPDCNVCGYETDTAHTYGDTWSSDEDGHWNVCSECGEESKPVPHVPGPEATETDAQLCTVCGFEIAPPKEHVHEFPEDWKSDSENHWKECECGETEASAAHTWDEGTEGEGILIYLCTECGEERTEVVEEAGFPWGILAVVLILALAAVVAILVVILLKKPAGKFHG